ncbi:MAG TPA: hypothetical protein V6D19_12950 [Stenomitos sp.]
MSTNNFKFNLIEEFSGYNSARDKTTIDPSFLIRGSKNVYFKRSGAVANRHGLKLRGEVDATEAGTKSSYEWQTNFGVQRNLRVNNNRLQVESDIITPDTYLWYDILTGFTNERFVFDTWWDATLQKSVLLMVNGENNIKYWYGGVGVISSFSTVTGAVVGNGNTVNGVIVNANGTGYAVGDILELDGGSDSARVMVTFVTGGIVNFVKLIDPGSGYVNTVGGTTTAVTGGGSGATFDFTVTTRYKINATESFLSSGFLDNINGVTATTQLLVNVNGTEYQYVGISSDGLSLLGVTPDPTAEAVGSVITTKVFTASDEPVTDYECDFIEVLNNQLIVGSYSSRVVYISSDEDFLDFENAGDYVSGDPDQIVLDNFPTGIGIQNAKAIIFGGNADLYVVTLNFPVEYVTGINRTITTKVEKKELSANSAALGHEFIGNFGDDLIWLDQKNQLRAQGSFADLLAIKPALLSLAVQEELTEDDFTGGAVRVIEDTIYITAPATGRDWMYQIREVFSDLGQITAQRLWHPPQVRNISRFALIDGIIYGHSAQYPQLYQVWDTEQWYDDNPLPGNEDGVPYGSNMKMAYRNHGKRFLLKKFDRLAFEGYMELGTTLKAYVYYEYQGSKAIKLININKPAEEPSEAVSARFYSGVSPFSLGDSSLGDNPLGIGIVPEGNQQDALPKFRAIRTLGEKDIFEYSIELFSENVGDRWEILTIGDNAELAPDLPIVLQKERD